MSKPCGCLDPPFKGLNCRLPKIEKAVREMLDALDSIYYETETGTKFNEGLRVGYQNVLKLFEDLKLFEEE